MPSSSAYGQCLDAVAAKINSLTMSGVSNTAAVVQHYPYRDQKTLPFISVSPALSGEQVIDATNAREDIAYGIIIAIYAVDAPSSIDARLLWRQQIRRALHNQSLSGITAGTFIHSKVVPLAPVDAKALTAEKLFVTALRVNVTLREFRTQ